MLEEDDSLDAVWHRVVRVEPVLGLLKKAIVGAGERETKTTSDPSVSRPEQEKEERRDVQRVGDTGREGVGERVVQGVRKALIERVVTKTPRENARAISKTKPPFGSAGTEEWGGRTRPVMTPPLPEDQVP